MGLAAPVRPHDHGAVQAFGRLDGLPARALHDGRPVRARGHALLRAPLPPGMDLPVEPDHQLVPVPRDVALRSRARARGDGRRPDLRALSLRRRLRGRGDDRDRPAGDDARRRCGCREPGGRSLAARSRTGRDRAVRRARGARDRRRARRPGVRDGRAEGDARSRPARLRDRARPRAARADGDRPRRPYERRGRRAGRA